MKKSDYLNMNYKKSFSLIELIVVILISSIILIYTFSFAKELQQTQIQNQQIAILKIDMNSTKIIIEKNLSNIQHRLSYDGQTLFLDKNILLKNVNSFSQKSYSGILQIDINLENKISQTWEFKL